MLALANSLIGVDASLSGNIAAFIAAALLAMASPLLAQGQVPAAAVPWATGVLAIIVVAALQIQEYLDFSDTGLLYSLFAIAAYGPIALDFLVASLAGIPMAIGCIIVSLSLQSDASVDWMIGSAAAFLISAVLLAIRQRGADALARALAMQASLAVEDPLTGLLNRRGLGARVPQFFALAVRDQREIAALFVDIDGLKWVNDQHGHHFGDAVINATAAAIGQAVRDGDLICRWDGDKFLVVGMGVGWDQEAMATRIRASIADNKLPAKLWSGKVTFGWGSIDPSAATFEELVQQADADMYARRAGR